MPINKEMTPPPKIGKIGPYTVFVTPPATPKSASEPVCHSPKKPVYPPPPVQPPPLLYKPPPSARQSPSVFGFFRNAVAKVQNAHSSLDDYVAYWFGLNQSKYQWALDDYYEGKEADRLDTRGRDVSDKIQND